MNRTLLRPVHRRLVIAAAAAVGIGLAARAAAQDPGAVYALQYAGTVGEPGVPWYRSAAQLSGPAGLGARGDDLWVADGIGRRAVKFSSGGRYLAEIGRAGDVAGLNDEPPVGEIVDADTWFRPTQPPTATPTGGVPTPTPRRPGRPLDGFDATRPVDNGASSTTNDGATAPGSVSPAEPNPVLAFAPDAPFGSDAQPAPADLAQATPPPGEEIVWLVDRAMHDVIVVDRVNGYRQVLGTPGEAGTDDDHLSSPGGVAVDADGNAFVADTANHRIQVYGLGFGVLATLGETGTPGADGAHFNRPGRLSFGTDGLLYVADAGNHRVVALDVTDLFDVKPVRSYGSGRGAAVGQLDGPTGVAADNQFVYVADGTNCRVSVFRRLERTHWEDIGTPGACGTDASPMRRITDVAVDGTGNLYVSDPDRHVVWRRTAITPRIFGVVFGSIDVPYLTDDAHFNGPEGVAVAADGMRYVVEGAGQRILKLGADDAARWTTGEPGVSGADGTHLDDPADVAITAAGNAAVVERGGMRVRIFAAADGAQVGTIGGPGTGQGQFDRPEGIGAAADGRLAVADTGNARVQIFDAGGNVVMTLRGLSGVDYAAPTDAAFDSAGRVYVADAVRQFVAVYDAAYNLIRVLGQTNTAGDAFDRFDAPRRLAIGPGDVLFVADTGNERVQVFDKAGAYLTTIGGVGGSGNGAFRTPLGLAVDAAGGLIVADRDNHRLQRFTPAVEPWTAGSVNGFGARDMGSVSALADYNGALVAGTADDSSGAAIWRRQAGATAWSKVADGGLGSADNRAVTDLAIFGDKLWAGTLNARLDVPGTFGQPDVWASDGGEIWSSADGSQWTRAVAGGLGDKTNAGVSAVFAFNGQLYAGTSGLMGDTDIDGDFAPDPTGGGLIYRSATGAAGSWTRVLARVATTPRYGITAMAAMSGTLYASSCGWERADGAGSGIDVVRSANGQSWASAGTFAVEGARRGCVGALAPYDNYLYAAVGGDDRLGGDGTAIEIWRCALCDGTDWEQVASGGIADPGNAGRVSFAAFDPPPFHFLYVAVGNAEGTQVWRAPDGLRWEPVALDGFGDPNNADVYGARSLAVWSDRLFVGTVNTAHGGELWSTAGGRPSTIPTPPGPGAGATPTPRPRVDPPTGRARYAFVEQWPIPQAVPQDVMGGVIDVEVADDATVYLLDRTNNRVMRMDAKGKWLAAFGNLGRGPERLGQAGAMAVDSGLGRVYVSDQASDRLLLYGLDGTFMDAWPNIHAVGIVPLPDGTLWVADRLAGAIRHLASDGAEIERFLTFGDREDDQFRTMADIALDPADGTLYVGDLNGQRLRLFRDDGTGWRRVKTVNFATRMYGGLGCSSLRMITLGPGRILVNRCLFVDDDYNRSVPGNLTGSDLYGITLRAANLSAGLFYAVAVYDTDRLDAFNETWPAVVRFTDNGYDIVDRFWRGRNPLGAAAEGLINGPVRLSTMPNGNLSLTDAVALQERAPNGTVVDTLGFQSSPGDAERFALQPDLSIAQGTDHHVMGFGAYQRVRRNYDGTFRVISQRPIVAYGKAVTKRYCSAFQTPRCQVYPYFEKQWETTLPTELEGAAAVAHEPTLDQFVLLARVHTAPWTRGIEQIEYRLYAYKLGFRGRKEIVELPGEDIDVIWADVDAGPDGRIYVLDTLNDRVKVLGADLKDIAMVATPKDSWRVAGGPNGEIYVMTVYGHVVRMAADGAILSRFEGMPHQGVSPVSQVDLTVDGDGWVYTVDNLANQVTVFAPEPGTEDEVLQGGTCNLLGDKYAAPTDVLLGDKLKVFLTILGSCGFQEQPADIVLAINTFGGTLGDDPGRTLANSVRSARQIAALTDLDRHRLGVVSYSKSGVVEQSLTNDSYKVVRGLRNPRADNGVPSRNYAGLKTASDLFDAQSATRRRVIVLVSPEPPATTNPNLPPTDDPAAVALADSLRAAGVLVITVNESSPVASGDLFDDIQVLPRAMGAGRPVHRRMLERYRPAYLVKSGALVDKLPANMVYVPDSADPPATWDAAARTLTWNLLNLPISTSLFSFEVRPSEEGEWPTNIEARADVTADGWDHKNEVRYPIPRVRVYGEPPPTKTPTPTRTLTPEPTATPRPTGVPVPIYLPILLKMQPCKPETKSVDIALVIDTSGSMSETTSPGGPTKLQAATDAARTFLGQLVAGRDQATLVQFNNAAHVVVPLSDGGAAAVAGLALLTQDNGTRIDLGLDAAAGALAVPERKASNTPVIILLTDGEPTGATPDEVRVAALRAKGAGMLVYTIGLGTSIDVALMRDVATKPEWFYSAPDTADLAAIYGQIAFEIPCKLEWP